MERSEGDERTSELSEIPSVLIIREGRLRVAGAKLSFPKFGEAQGEIAAISG
jgi:hypothetical protein